MTGHAIFVVESFALKRFHSALLMPLRHIRRRNTTFRKTFEVNRQRERFVVREVKVHHRRYRRLRVGYLYRLQNVGQILVFAQTGITCQVRPIDDVFQARACIANERQVRGELAALSLYLVAPQAPLGVE